MNSTVLEMNSDGFGAMEHFDENNIDLILIHLTLSSGKDPHSQSHWRHESHYAVHQGLAIEHWVGAKTIPSLHGPLESTSWINPQMLLKQTGDLLQELLLSEGYNAPNARADALCYHMETAPLWLLLEHRWLSAKSHIFEVHMQHPDPATSMSASDFKRLAYQYYAHCHNVLTSQLGPIEPLPEGYEYLNFPTVLSMVERNILHSKLFSPSVGLDTDTLITNSTEPIPSRL